MYINVLSSLSGRTCCFDFDRCPVEFGWLPVLQKPSGLPFQEDILADRAARKIRIEREMAQEQRRQRQQARLALSTRLQKEKPGLVLVASSCPKTFVRYDSVRIRYSYTFRVFIVLYTLVLFVEGLI